MTAVTSLHSISRSKDFWFDDGTIVLQVESTQFRVHRGIICADSVVFRDMYATSDPGQRDIVDNCPVVVLHGDSSSDWNILLEYVYFPAKDAIPGAYIPFSKTAPLLRLGKKYEFTRIRSVAVHVCTLLDQVPTDPEWFELWDGLFEELPDGILPEAEIPGKWLDGNEIHLVNLAIEQDIQSILPILYYLCVHRFSLDTLLTGVLPNGNNIGKLNPNTLRVILLGREKLRSVYHSVNMGWLTRRGVIPAQHCAYITAGIQGEQTPCAEARLASLEKLVSPEEDRHAHQALNVIRRSWPDAFCDVCKSTLLEVHYQDRHRIWGNLPTYFGLPSWDELEDPEPS